MKETMISKIKQMVEQIFVTMMHFLNAFIFDGSTSDIKSQRGMNFKYYLDTGEASVSIERIVLVHTVCQRRDTQAV